MSQAKMGTGELPVGVQVDGKALVPSRVGAFTVAELGTVMAVREEQ